MNAVKCRFKGCKTMHKSPTGYCAKHVEKVAMRRTMTVREGRTEPVFYDKKEWE